MHRRRTSAETEQLLLNNQEYEADESNDLLTPGATVTTTTTTTNADANNRLLMEKDVAKQQARKNNQHPWYRRIIDFVLKQDSRKLSKHDKLKRLPPRKMRYSSWKYEVLRPWEPQPPINYYHLVHKANPWYDKPPSSTRRLMFLLCFAIFTYSCCFIPYLFFNESAFYHRQTVVKVPTWFLPWWANIVLAIFCHATNTIAIWFVYLTGGFVKHWKIMLPYFLMMACEAIWPDVLFSVRSISVAALICITGWIFSGITICLFFWVMGYAGFCIIFYWLFCLYEIVVLCWIWYLNGAAY